MYFFACAGASRSAVKEFIIAGAPGTRPDYDVATHFTPRYNPWDQRLCLVPDADLFHAIKAGRAIVVTDTIEAFTETGIRLAFGRELEADIVVTATGLKMELLGGMRSTSTARTSIAKT